MKKTKRVITLVVEWLNKDGMVMFRRELPLMNFGDSVQIAPVVPANNYAVCMDNFTTPIGRKILTDAGNKLMDQFMKETVTSFRIIVKKSQKKAIKQ